MTRMKELCGTAEQAAEKLEMRLASSAAADSADQKQRAYRHDQGRALTRCVAKPSFSAACEVVP